MTHEKGRPASGSWRAANADTGARAAAVRIPAAALHPAVIVEGVERAADVALANGQPTIFTGATGTMLTVCDDFNCCGELVGSFVVVPDIVLAELEANGHDVPRPGWLLQRNDDRSVHIYAVQAVSEE